MNNSGEAAEQVVRLSLEGVEVTAKIVGNAAKEVAALLYAVFKNRDKNKIKGKQRLTSMLKSGKELSIFSVKNDDMKRFVADAKRYGIVYCVLRNPKGKSNGECEIMVRAEDAAKINRIVENIKIATVLNPEAIREEVNVSKTDTAQMSVLEKDTPIKDADDLLIDEMFDKPKQKEENTHKNPTVAKTTKPRRSEPFSKSNNRSAEGTEMSTKPSVRKELQDIRNAQKQKEAKTPAKPDRADRNTNNSRKIYPQHRQQSNKKPRTKKTKER